MQPVLSPARDVDFGNSNSESASTRGAHAALVGWAMVMGISIVSFLVHVHPDDGMAAEQAAQGLLVMGAAAALAHGSAVRLAGNVSGTAAL